MAIASEERRSTPRGRPKVLWIREPYLDQILAGRKTVEVRVGYSNIQRLKPGARLKLNDRHLVTVSRIARYATFEELLAREDPTAIAPDLPAEQLLLALREIYPPEKEALGVIALELARRRHEAILFDVGYTLVYFEPEQVLIVQDALRSIGEERSLEQIQTAVSEVFREYYQDAATATFPATPEYDAEKQPQLQERVLARLEVDASPQKLRAYLAALEAWYSRPGVVRPYPEAFEVLSALQARGYRLGIVSNWSWNLRNRVAQVGLDSFFEVVWASAYAGCNKPHPGIFLQALDQMGILPARALYVGDNYEQDVVGARNAGLQPILLDRRGTASERDCPVIHDLRGVLDLLAD